MSSRGYLRGVLVTSLNPDNSTDLMYHYIAHSVFFSVSLVLIKLSGTVVTHMHHLSRKKCYVFAPPLRSSSEPATQRLPDQTG